MVKPSGAVGEMLWARMVARGFNQSTLAKASGDRLTQSYISQVVRGDIAIPRDDKIAIFDELIGLSKADFYRADGRLPEEEERDGSSPLDEVISILEDDPEVGPQLAEIKRTQTPRVYREAVEALAEAWRANAKMMFRTFRAGQEARSQ